MRVKEAVIADDLQAYRTTKADLRAAQEALEIHTARRAALDAAPLITPEKYESLCSGVMDELKGLREEIAQECAAFADQMNKAADKLQSAQQGAKKHCGACIVMYTAMQTAPGPGTGGPL